MRNNKYSYFGRIVALVLIFISIFALPANAEEKSDPADINVNEIVMGHMADAYEWHIFSYGNVHVTIPLPVIVYSSESGWNVFLSNKLNDEKMYQGFKIAPKDSELAGKVVEQVGGVWQRPTLDLSLTKVAFALIINSFIFALIILGVARWYKRHDEKSPAPKGFVGFMEMFIMMINDEVIKACVGPNYRKFAPYLLTVFFFRFVNNIMGLVPIFPGGVGVTGNIAITLILALCTFVAVNFWATKAYWKEVFWPDVPMFLKLPIPILPLIEVMSVFTKPFALMIRLFANMIAGHMGLLIFVSLTFISAKMGAAVQGGLTVVSVLFTLFMNLLELLVAFIQAYVFTLLSAIFIGLAQESHETSASNEEEL